MKLIFVQCLIQNTNCQKINTTNPVYIHSCDVWYTNCSHQVEKYASLWNKSDICIGKTPVFLEAVAYAPLVSCIKMDNSCPPRNLEYIKEKWLHVLSESGKYVKEAINNSMQYKVHQPFCLFCFLFLFVFFE